MNQSVRSSPPLVSVVVPAYNQARYLADAVRSVLAQTFRDYEVVVVDDGSTDDTLGVAGQFGDSIRYVRQANQGLGGARNTGIRAATGRYVALLDSDDEWLPGFLAAMLALAEQHAAAAVVYCQARCMTEEGATLPQVMGGPPREPQALYQSLLRANFLIPSTIVMRRDLVAAAGLFDASLRSCEDWDLWLRLLPAQLFVGSSDCLVRYRIHGASLSANLNGMFTAARAVVEKHFGVEDASVSGWTAEKRRAYGGLYRYQAITSVVRQDNWRVCAQHVERALEIDPSLSEDVGLYYELALGDQPVGYRGTPGGLHLETTRRHLAQLLDDVFGAQSQGRLAGQKRTAYGTAYFALGLAAYHTGNMRLCRPSVWRAIRYRPELRNNSLAVGTLFRSFVKGTPMEALARKTLGVLR